MVLVCSVVAGMLLESPPRVLVLCWRVVGAPLACSGVTCTPLPVLVLLARPRCRCTSLTTRAVGRGQNVLEERLKHSNSGVVMVRARAAHRVAGGVV
jgi:hypothetical protein